MLSVGPGPFEVLKNEIPFFQITREPGWNTISRLIDALTGPEGLFQSKKDAKRAIQQGGFYVNGERVGPEQTEIPELLYGRFLLVKKGARNFALVEVTGG